MSSYQNLSKSRESFSAPDYQRAITKANATRCARKVVILGSRKSGKTALLKRFLTNEYDDDYYPTVEECYKHNYSYKGFNLNLDIIDMCGPFMFPVMRDLNLKSAHVILLVYEIGDIESIQEAVSAYKNIIEKQQQYKATVLVGTKFDKYSKRVNSAAEYEQNDEMFSMLPQVNAGHVVTSARTNLGVKEAFELGLLWHVTNKHSGSLIASRDVLKVAAKKRCTIL